MGRSMPSSCSQLHGTGFMRGVQLSPPEHRPYHQRIPGAVSKRPSNNRSKLNTFALSEMSQSVSRTRMKQRSAMQLTALAGTRPVRVLLYNSVGESCAVSCTAFDHLTQRPGLVCAVSCTARDQAAKAPHRFSLVPLSLWRGTLPA